MHNSLTSRSTLLAAVLLQLTTVVLAQPPTNWTVTPFNPPSNPLAVKSPYLNAWAPLAGGSAALNQAWPRSYDPLGNVSHTYTPFIISKIANPIFVADPRMVRLHPRRRRRLFAPRPGERTRRDTRLPKVAHIHTDAILVPL